MKFAAMEIREFTPEFKTQVGLGTLNAQVTYP